MQHPNETSARWSFGLTPIWVTIPGEMVLGLIIGPLIAALFIAREELLPVKMTAALGMVLAVIALFPGKIALTSKGLPLPLKKHA